MRKTHLALVAAALVAFAGSAAAADVTDNLDIQAEVFNECSIDVQDSYREVYGLSIETASPNAGVVTVYCNLDTPWTVEMDTAGQNFGLGAGPGAEDRRALSDGAGEFLSYSIYQAADFGLFWGEGATAVSGVGTGAGQQLSYHFKFFNANLVSDGMYTDSVPVTLIYN